MFSVVDIRTLRTVCDFWFRIATAIYVLVQLNINYRVDKLWQIYLFRNQKYFQILQVGFLGKHTYLECVKRIWPSIVDIRSKMVYKSILLPP